MTLKEEFGFEIKDEDAERMKMSILSAGHHLADVVYSWYHDSHRESVLNIHTIHKERKRNNPKGTAKA